MRALLPLLLFCLSINAQTRQFKVEQSNLYGGKITVQTFKQPGAGGIDLIFYRNHFVVPPYFPNEFISPKYKNKTIVEWSYPKRKKDFYDNWTYTTVYDKKSRVIRYSWSGCNVCNELPYTIFITYDVLNRPIKLIKTPNSNNKAVDESGVNPTYLVTYSRGNEVKSVREYHGTRFIQQVTLIK